MFTKFDVNFKSLICLELSVDYVFLRQNDVPVGQCEASVGFFGDGDNNDNLITYIDWYKDF